MATDGGRLRVEIAYATPEQQTLLVIDVAPGTTVGEAITASAITARHPEIDLATLDVGIFSQRCGLDALVEDGDRVELYRPLQIDPMERRRRRAQNTRR